MSLQEIILLLTTYGYLFLFPIVVIEGPIITVIAGFLSSLHIFNILIAYAVIVTADMTGDVMYYAIGYYGRYGFFEKWGRFLGVTVERMKRMEEHFKKHSGKTLVVGKLSQVIGAAVLAAAGMAKMPFWKFVWYNFIITIPKSLTLLLIGFYFGETYNKINKYFDYTSIITVGLAIILIVIYLMVRKVSKKYEDEDVN